MTDRHFRICVLICAGAFAFLGMWLAFTGLMYAAFYGLGLWFGLSEMNAHLFDHLGAIPSALGLAVGLYVIGVLEQWYEKRANR